MRESKSIPNYRKHWILVDKQIIETDLMGWARWFEKRKNRVAFYSSCGIDVSTIFLGINHGWSHVGPPVLFETMIFGDRRNDYEPQWRYCTYEDAINGHNRIVHELDIGFPSPYWFKYYWRKLLFKIGGDKMIARIYGNELISMFKKK